MYIHLGQGTVVRSRDVLGIFDLDSTTVSKHTRKFLEKAEKKRRRYNRFLRIAEILCGCERKRQNKGIYFPACNLYPFKTVGFYRFFIK